MRSGDISGRFDKEGTIVGYLSGAKSESGSLVPPGTSSGVKDVIVDGLSVVEDKIATIPFADEDIYGVVKTSQFAKPDELAKTEYSLDMLWKLNQGQTYDIVSKEEKGIALPPSGAKYETLLEGYGESEQDSTNGYNVLPNRESKQTMYVNYNSDTDVYTFVCDNSSGEKVIDTADILLAPRCVLRDYIKPSTDYTFLIEFLRNDSTAVNSEFTILNGYSSLQTIFTNHQILYLLLHDKGYVTRVVRTSKAEDQISYDTLNYNIFLRVYMAVQPGEKVDFDVRISLVETANESKWSYEPYTGGYPSPNPDYPQEIHSVEELNFKVTNGDSVKEFTIIPPRKLNRIGEYRDVCDVENGVWIKRIESVLLNSLRWTDNTTFAHTFNSNTYASKIVRPRTTIDVGMIKSNAYVAHSSNTLGNIDFSVGIGTAGTIYVNDNRFVNATNFKNGLTDEMVIFALATPETTPISETDLELLRSIRILGTDNVISVTDQDGNDVSYLMEYIIKLSEVAK